MIYRGKELSPKFNGIWTLPLVWYDCSSVTYPSQGGKASFEPDYLIGEKKRAGTPASLLVVDYFRSEVTTLRELPDTYIFQTSGSGDVAVSVL